MVFVSIPSREKPLPPAGPAKLGPSKCRILLFLLRLETTDLELSYLLLPTSGTVAMSRHLTVTRLRS